MTICNTTLEDEYINELPLWKDGLTFHHLGLIISAAFGMVSVVVALFIIMQHATHYSKPWEQKHIIRILFMIPVYSVVSFLSYLNYRHALYYEVLEDCYEAFAIASFFTLLCNYIAPNLHDQKEFFRHLTPQNWFWSVFGLQKLTGGKNKGPLRIPRSGLTWFNVCWISIFQYCVVMVIFTVVSVVTNYFGRYCAESDSPAFAHIWVDVIEAASVTVAMFCLVQFYLQLRYKLAPKRPFLKVLCIKLVIFFSFWQSLFISFLSSNGPLSPNKYLAYPDIIIGIPAGLICIEMAIFSIMHIFAFSWKPYMLPSTPASKDEILPENAETYTPPDDQTTEPPLTYQGGRFGYKALGEAFNPWDMIKACARGFRWLFVGRRSRFLDPSYNNQDGRESDLSPAKTTTDDTGALTPTPSIKPVRSDDAEEMDDIPMHPGYGPKSPDPRLPSHRAEDDRAGLLSNAAGSTPPRYGYSPHSTSYPPPGMAHGFAAGEAEFPDAGAYGGADGTYDTSYHGAGGAAGAPHTIGVAYGGDEGWTGDRRYRS